MTAESPNDSKAPTAYPSRNSRGRKRKLDQTTSSQALVGDGLDEDSTIDVDSDNKKDGKRKKRRAKGDEVVEKRLRR